jgi:hypothetical protein
MSRKLVIYKIGDMIETNCNGCIKRSELVKQHGAAFAHIDGYCNKQCDIGQQLQSLGKQLGR